MKFKIFVYGALGVAMFVAGWCIGYGIQGMKIENRMVTVERIPTIEEIQERIGAVPDGILGPETQRLWELALCEQYAERYFNTKDTKAENVADYK